MAVKYVKNNSLGNLGTIASIAGTVTGQPWLTVLGQGLNAYNGFRNAGSSLSGGYITPGFENQNNNPFSWLGGIFSGNIAANNDNKSQRGK